MEYLEEIGFKDYPERWLSSLVSPGQIVPDIVPKELLVLPSDAPGKVRLSRVRARLWENPIDGASLVNYAVSTYLDWVRETEYLIMGKYDPLSGFTNYRGFKASKRGNDVYAKRVREAWSPLMELPDVYFFDYKDRSKNHQTRALFTSHTYAPRGKTIGEAWEDVGKDWNLYITRLRKKYGGIQCARVFEAHKGRAINNYIHRGYPHIHAIMLFDTHEFTAFHHKDAWRVYGKDDIARMWTHGFTDVEALSSTKGGFHYIAKYLGKLHELGQVSKSSSSRARALGDVEYREDGSNLVNLPNQASVLSLSLMWIHRKRAFSISGKLADSIRTLHNSNQEHEYYALLQVDLEGEFLPERVTQWVLCGFFAGELIKGGKVRWSVELSHKEFREISNSVSYNDRLLAPAMGWCDIECAIVSNEVGFQ